MTHTIKNGLLTVTAGELGAQLMSVLGADGTEYLWQGDPAYWPDRALNIFPFVARLTGGRYSLDGQVYAMPIHGIAPTARFTAEENTGERLTMALYSDGETRSAYPRDFVFRVVYALSGSRLSVTYEVENRDARPMIFGLGGHPGFNVPLRAGLDFTDYSLRFSEKCAPARVGFTPECFLDGAEAPFPLVGGDTLPLRHGLFDEDAIVLRGMCREVTLGTDRDPRSVTVTFPDMPYLGIWHAPRTDAPYVCVEPWLSLPAKAGELTVFERRPDLRRLAPGETYRNTWTIRINA